MSFHRGKTCKTDNPTPFRKVLQKTTLEESRTTPQSQTAPELPVTRKDRDLEVT